MHVQKRRKGPLIMVYQYIAQPCSISDTSQTLQEQGTDPRQFLGLEAVVDRDSDPENYPRYRAYTDVGDEWDALLERARARPLLRRESTPDTPGPFAIGPSFRLASTCGGEFLVTLLLSIRLIVSKLGWEETVAFTLVHKSIRNENHQWRLVRYQ